MFIIKKKFLFLIFTFRLCKIISSSENLNGESRFAKFTAMDFRGYINFAHFAFVGVCNRTRKEVIRMLKKNLELLVSELEKAELEKDGSIKVDMNWSGSIGTINYSDFRCFCNELIRKIRTG